MVMAAVIDAYREGCVTMGFDELSQEMREKAKACGSIEELAALCEQEGIKLSDEEIQDLAGGEDPHEPPRGGKCVRVSGPRCQTACGMHFG